MDEEASSCFLPTATDTLYIELLSLQAILLPKLPRVDVQNGLSTVMVFYTAFLFLITLHSEWSLAMLIHWYYNFIHHHEAESMTKQWNGLWRLSYSASKVAVGAKAPGRGYKYYKSASIGVILSPLARIHGSRDQGVEMRGTPLTIIPSNLLAKSCFPSLIICCFAGREVLASKRRVLSPGDTAMIPLNWVKTATCHLGLLRSLNQQAKKGVSILAGVIDPDYLGAVGLCYTIQ